MKIEVIEGIGAETASAPLRAGVTRVRHRRAGGSTVSSGARLSRETGRYRATAGVVYDIDLMRIRGAGAEYSAPARGGLLFGSEVELAQRSPARLRTAGPPKNECRIPAAARRVPSEKTEVWIAGVGTSAPAITYSTGVAIWLVRACCPVVGPAPRRLPRGLRAARSTLRGRHRDRGRPPGSQVPIDALPRDDGRRTPASRRGLSLPFPPHAGGGNMDDAAPHGRVRRCGCRCWCAARALSVRRSARLRRATARCAVAALECADAGVARASTLERRTHPSTALQCATAWVR